jgi:hypothetical protein
MQRGVRGGGNRTSGTEFGQEGSLTNQTNRHICIVDGGQSELCRFIIGSSFQSNGPLAHLGNKPFGIETLGDLFVPPQTIKSCRSGHDGIDPRLVSGRKSRGHIPAELNEVQIGASLCQQGPSPRRTSGDRGTRTQTGERSADEDISGVATFGNAGNDEALGRNRRQVFGRVDGYVGPAFEYGVLDFSGKDSLTGNGGERNIILTITSGNDFDNFTRRADKF